MKREDDSKSVVKRVRAGIAAVRKKITGKKTLKAAAEKTKSKTRPTKKSTAETEEEVSASKTPRSQTSPKNQTVPSILLEGDQPSPSPLSGPGQKFVLTPDVPEPESATPEGEAELPEAYGTKKLFIAARDPHWLYAHWDLTTEQLKRLNSLSAHKHLVLRVYLNEIGAAPAVEIHVHPESRHWFVHVDKANAKYAAELGYYGTNHKWKRVSISGPTLTPPDSSSDDLNVLFATIPIDLPFAKLVALVKEAMRQNISLVAALEQLRTTGHPQLPGKSTPPSQWTPAQEKALATVLSMDEVRRVWLGSLEITELIRRQLGRELSSVAFSPFGGLSSVSSLGSAFGGMPGGQKGFWFNVNAELIIYGATEPDATVTIGGREIKLRLDGSFSYRFALPDGQYELPIVAVSADKTDARAAELNFNRTTDYRGEVGTHPQDPQLKSPLVQNIV